MPTLGSIDRSVVEDSARTALAEHRLVEVSVGIATGLIVTAVWPLRASKAAAT